MSLKTKTIHGLKWSFTDSAVNQIIHFLVGIVLARLLSPSEYGIVGILMVFIAISQSIVDSGLTQALIRKQNCTEADYNTMFYTNIAMGLLMYGLLYLGSGILATFYKMQELKLLTKVMGLNVIINSFGLIETAKLVKQINFKLQTKISLVASLGSGGLAISLALIGFGYWSLVFKSLSENVIRVILLWILSNWKPKLQYSIESLRELLTFGVKIMLTGLLEAVYANVYKLVIGKFFTIRNLGLYTRAEQFSNLPSRNIDLTAQRVTYPVLVSLANDDHRLKIAYKKLIKLSFYITSTLMLFMLATSREIIMLSIGAKWSEAVLYLQILCISGSIFPLLSLNVNVLKVKNRPDLILKLAIVKKVIAIPFIVFGVWLGMVPLLWLMTANSLLSFYMNSIASAKILHYSTLEQILDVTPSVMYSVVMLGLLLSVNFIVPNNFLVSLGLKGVLAVIFVVLTGEMFKRYEYMELKGIVKKQLII